MEVWKDVPGQDLVQASSLGRLRVKHRTFVTSRKGRTFIKSHPAYRCSPWIAHNGYYHIVLRINNKKRKLLVHRLIAITFCEGFSGGLHVNHINGIKTDNRPENLEWISNSENVTKAWKMGLVNLRGENNPQAKLNQAEVAEIRRLLSQGQLQEAVAQKFSISPSLVSAINSRRRWAHT